MGNTARGQPLASVDVAFAAKELTLIVGSRLNRIYCQDAELVLVFSTKSEGKRIFQASLPENACFLGQKQDAAENPGMHTSFLRKRIEGAFLESARQIGFDRVLELGFRSHSGDSGISNHWLVLELFSKGNWFILDENGIILMALHEQEWKDRTLKKGLKYAPPKPVLQLPSLEVEELHTSISASSRDSIVKALAIDLGLGGLYAEEFCSRASLNRKMVPADFSKKDAFMLHAAVKEVFSREPAGFVYIDAISPIPLLSCQDSLKEQLPSFLESRAFFSSVSGKVSAVQKELEKAILIRQRQIDGKVSAESEAMENTSKAEWIYSHYQEVKELLETMRSSKKGPDLAKELLAKHSLEGSFDEEKGVLAIEVAEHSPEYRSEP